MKLSVQIRVLRGGELLIFKTVAPGRTVTLGPSRSDTIPTIAFERSHPLLVAGREGYGVRLGSSLAGQLTVAGRRLRIQEGLLLDPRPEPLLLRGGDHGWIHLEKEGGLTLEFQVQERPACSRFSARPALDRGLLLSLGATALVAAVALLLLAPWSYQGKAKHRTVRLKTRPAILSLTKLRPRPIHRSSSSKHRTEQASSSHDRRRRSVAKLQRPKGKRPGRPSALELLQKNKRVANLIGRRSDSRQVQEILTSMTMTMMEARATGGSHGGSGLSELLGGAEAESIGPDSTRPGQLLGLPLSSLNTRQQPRSSGTVTKNPSREAIRKVVVAHQRMIRLCYERELISSTKPVEGRLLLRWQIDRKGRAIQVQVEKDTVGSQALKRCVISRIRSWRFPPCDPSCSVVYPFDFFPRMS